MNTNKIAQQLADVITNDTPSRASVNCIMYTLRDSLKEATSTLCVYNRADLTKSLDKIDVLTSALRTLSAIDTTLQRLNSLIEEPATTEPEEA